MSIGVDSTVAAGNKREQRERIREEMKILSHTVQSLFIDHLPGCGMNYLIDPLDPDPDADQSCSSYLAEFMELMQSTQGVSVLPLNTTGDGSCMLHAVSRGARCAVCCYYILCAACYCLLLYST